MITPEQCRSARAWLDWSQDDLASRANVSLSTVRDFEKGRRIPIANNIVAIETVLAAAGVTPTSHNGEPAGIRFEHRIKERDTYLHVLDLLDDTTDGFMATSDIIIALEHRLAPQGEDAEILASRSDTRFSQIVRNIVSHRDTPTNLIGAGWAEYDSTKRGLRITAEGRKHLLAEQERLKNGP